MKLNTVKELVDLRREYRRELRKEKGASRHREAP